MMIIVFARMAHFIDSEHPLEKLLRLLLSDSSLPKAISLGSKARECCDYAVWVSVKRLSLAKAFVFKTVLPC